MKILEAHRKNCEKQGKYVEAEIAKNRLEELKVHEENRRREAMRSRQIAERLGVEEAHMLEFQQFNIIWDKNQADYEAHAAKLRDDLKARHTAELTDFQKSLVQKMGSRPPKFSRELLNLRKIQETLAKQKDYKEAHKMKLKADSIEAYELEKVRSDMQVTMYNKEARIIARQKKEQDALDKRIQAAHDEQKKQRQADLERLLQRYQNVKKELEQQQNLERLRMNKYVGQNPRTLGLVRKKKKKKKRMR